MRQSRARGRQRRERLSLQDKGYQLCAFGVAAVFFPLLAGKSPVLAGLSAAAGPIGWMALAGGLAMLGLHRLQAAKSPASDPASSDPVNTPRPAKPRAAPAPVSVTAPAHPATHWSPAVFAAIEWRRFEAVCEALFAQAGFETKSQSHGADGGVDIWLHSRNAQGPVAVVQCKHWQSKSVGVKEMREFFGVMAANKLTRGTYATTSSYTPDAVAFAKANGINALDGKALLALIAQRSRFKHLSNCNPAPNRQKIP